MLEVTYNISDIQRVFQRLIRSYWEAVDLTLEDLGRLGVERARKRLEERGSIRTGRLIESIEYNVDPPKVVIGTDVEYAPYVEYGTRPHIIQPVRAQALRFEVEGKVVYAMSVNHPGSWGSNPPPARYMKYALDSIRGNAVSILRNNILGKWSRI